MIKAYNDWHVDEWCGAYPERFIPCGILPLFDVDEAAEGGAPPREQGLPRGDVLREPRRPRHAEHPHRPLGPAVRRVLRRRHRAVLPRRVVVEGGEHVARRAAAGADEPLVGDVDLHARRPPVGRLLAPVPGRCASRSPRATSAGSPTSSGGPSTRSTATTGGCSTSSPQGLSPDRAVPRAHHRAASSTTASA